jgi:hypothetical protein
VFGSAVLDEQPADIRSRAGYVFLLDRWWNPAVEAQAVDRAQRIGQRNSVIAYLSGRGAPRTNPDAAGPKGAEGYTGCGDSVSPESGR